MPQPSVFASVALLKIHDFGRRPVVEQTRLRAQLEAVVAVTLGWAVAGEPFGLRHLAASAVIIGGVALITATRRRSPPLPPPGRPR